MAKKALVAVFCLVAIVLSVREMARGRRLGPAAGTAEVRGPWVCEACGREFMAPPGPGMRRCPGCGRDRAVQSVRAACAGCGTEFEACRMLDNYTAELPPGPGGRPPPPVALFKMPGGSWTSDRSQLRPAACPRCSRSGAAAPASAAPSE